MTTGKFSSIQIASITVNRETRQRRVIEVEELKRSIAAVGLINPITVDAQHVLIAGERRLTACAELGWTSIPAQYISDLDEAGRQLIELEENIKREELPWQDRVDAIARWHSLRKQENEGWRNEDTAKELGITSTYLGNVLNVKAEIDSGNTTVATADKITSAVTLTQRARERRTQAIMADIAAEAQVNDAPIVHADAFDWLSSYTGPKFNVLHCDFPYGINFQSQPGMALPKDAPRYDDSVSTYRNLVENLLPNLPIDDTAHMIFWFSMKHYAYTVTQLIQQGWSVHYRPLIWNRGHIGIAPDHTRYPRNVYETALFCTRGDRKTSSLVSDLFTYTETEKLHASAKPKPMLRHFLSAVVDGFAHVLDPTCGSAGALHAAKDLGAARVLGVEQDEANWKAAVDDWNKRG